MTKDFKMAVSKGLVRVHWHGFMGYPRYPLIKIHILCNVTYSPKGRQDETQSLARAP